MYIAELKGKFQPSEERKEDILTSNVFSFFKYTKREVFLHNLLSLLDICIEKSEMANAKFTFWPTYEDGTEPDLVIVVGNYYLLFEAKLHSGFGKGIELGKYQILREIKGGKLEARNLGKEFRFIAVTAHYSQHRFVEENSYIKELDYGWINWHQIALLIFNSLNSGELKDTETLSIAEDLYALLLRMNLRKFAGVKFFASNDKLFSSSDYLFFDPTTSEHRGDFIGFISTLSVLPKVLPASESIIFQRKPSLFSFNDLDCSINKIDTIFYTR